MSNRNVKNNIGDIKSRERGGKGEEEGGGREAFVFLYHLSFSLISSSTSFSSVRCAPRRFFDTLSR